MLISCVDATLDFEESTQFTLWQPYLAVSRKPTDPRAPVAHGLSLTDAEKRIHYGWVKEESRKELDRLLEAGYGVRVVVVKTGKKWKEYDDILQRFRHFIIGEGTYEAYTIKH